MGTKALAMQWGLESGEAGHLCREVSGLGALRVQPIGAVGRRIGFALLGEFLLAVARMAGPPKGTKKSCPSIRVSLRETSLIPSPLQGPAYKGHPWPFTPLAASMPLAPLRADSIRPSERGVSRRLAVRAMEKQEVVSSQRYLTNGRQKFVGWKTAQHFPPQAPQRLVSNVARKNRWVSFALPTLRPFIRVRELGSWTSLLPPALRGPAYKGHPWPFIAGTPSPLAASMSFAPLRAGSTRPSARGRVVSPVGPCMKKQSEASRCSFRRLGSEPPSGGRTQALRRGTRGMNAERGTKGQGCPFVTCPRSGAGVREVWARSGQTRMSGSPSLWLLSLGETRESDAPCKAQPVATATESAAPDINLHATGGGKRCAVFHPTQASADQMPTAKVPRC